MHEPSAAMEFDSVPAPALVHEAQRVALNLLRFVRPGDDRASLRERCFDVMIRCTGAGDVREDERELPDAREDVVLRERRIFEMRKSHRMQERTSNVFRGTCFNASGMLTASMLPNLRCR